jgi:hypothetical protein
MVGRMGLARAGLLRDTVGSLAVVVFVAAVTFGLPLLDRRLPDTRPVAAGVPYHVGGGVSVDPAPEAHLDVTKTRPGPDRGSALFIVRGVRVAVVVTPYRGDLNGAAERLHHKIARVADAQPNGDDTSVRTRTDISGSQGSYALPGRAGRYAVFVVAGLSAELTASGSDSDMARLRPELDSMITSITAGSSP